MAETVYEANQRKWREESAAAKIKDLAIAQKYVKEFPEIFGHKGKIEDIDPTLVVLTLVIGKYDNKPNRSKFRVEPANIHNYKEDPTFEAISSLGDIPNDVMRTSAGHGNPREPVAISFVAENIRKYEEEHGEGAWGKEMRKLKPQIEPILKKAEKQITAFETTHEKELKLEEAYQASKEYKLKASIPEAPLGRSERQQTSTRWR